MIRVNPSDQLMEMQQPPHPTAEIPSYRLCRLVQPGRRRRAADHQSAKLSDTLHSVLGSMQDLAASREVTLE